MRRLKTIKHKLKTAPDGKAFWIIIFVCFGLISWGLLSLLNSQAHPSVTSSTNSPAPKSNRPNKDEIDNYQVAPDLPRYIYIPPINVPKTRVKHLGVEKNGQIAVPDNIFDTGWYTGSAKPGQKGAMFIFGHISSWEANGIFHDLNKLKPGDEVTVERGDGQKYTYIVKNSKTYPADKVDMNAVLNPLHPNVPALNLMTCAGKVIKGTNNFSERLVVFTELK